jgi:hypothetical protein
MQEEKPQTGKSHRPSMKDISHILKGWEYEAGTINVRRITGNDGQPKLQMRLDLGLLQMEMDGRPDGERPHGCESLLDYFEKRLKEHRKKNGSEIGFRLNPSQCQSLREEALMYYHRYLSLFVLGEFLGVARDTARNLRVLDICGKYASDEQDRLVLEQYRPYVIMMNARALASIEFDANNFRRALSIVKRGMRDIREFFARFGQDDAYTHSNEVKILRRFGREIKRKLPVDPVKQLQVQLNRAVKEERYEEAARLRDEIEKQKPA